jgi:hypothetical protein
MSAGTALTWRGAPQRLDDDERVELATWCGVAGFVERRSEQRLPRRLAPADRWWPAVTKDVWAAAGIEVTRVSVEGDAVWRYGVDPDVARARARPRSRCGGGSSRGRGHPLRRVPPRTDHRAAERLAG